MNNDAKPVHASSNDQYGLNLQASLAGSVSSIAGSQMPNVVTGLSDPFIDSSYATTAAKATTMASAASEIAAAVAEAVAAAAKKSSAGSDIDIAKDKASTDADPPLASRFLQTRRITVPQTFAKRPATAAKRASLDDSQFLKLSKNFFGKVTQHHVLLGADKSTKYTIRMFPQIDRGFFQSENEWTCYRRNYFQISSYFWLCANDQPVKDAADCQCYIPLSPDINADNNTSTGAEDQSVDTTTSYAAVNGFSLGISARVSDDSTSVELVQHTPKRDKGPQTIPQPQSIRPSANGVAEAEDPDMVSFERLQFKTATANNGRRRAAQQYYILSLQIYADCANGKKVLLASTSSCPVVVRGRSPGHYIDGCKRRNTSVSKIPSSSEIGSKPLLADSATYLDAALPQEAADLQNTQKRKRQKQRQQKEHEQPYDKKQLQSQGPELEEEQQHDLSSLSELHPFNTSAEVSASSTMLTSSTDEVLSAAAAAMAAPRYDNFLANEVAQAFPDLNPTTAAVAAAAAAAAAAMASAKQQQQQQQQQSNSAIAMTTAINPLGLHTAIPLTMAAPITENPLQQISKPPNFASQFTGHQLKDQPLHTAASMSSAAATASLISIEKVPTEQVAGVDDKTVGAVQRSARADSLFGKT
ncbi:hypothetical protein FB639_000528 [Coemansia asiatica]|nr:hypothetical protein FB639_000528 [Coemansia asiatica]